MCCQRSPALIVPDQSGSMVSFAIVNLQVEDMDRRARRRLGRDLDLAEHRLCIVHVRGSRCIRVFGRLLPEESAACRRDQGICRGRGGQWLISSTLYVSGSIAGSNDIGRAPDYGARARAPTRNDTAGPSSSRRVPSWPAPVCANTSPPPHGSFRVLAAPNVHLGRGPFSTCCGAARS
jgi:hypothetical protein